MVPSTDGPSPPVHEWSVATQVTAGRPVSAKERPAKLNSSPMAGS